MKGLGMKTRPILWILAGGLLLAAGGATALLLANRRPVTTSSSAAYEAYQEATANEARFYFKEARLGFARALELDPNFAMAMLGLSRQSTDPEQGLALVRRAAKERGRLTEHERRLVDMALAFREKKNDEGLRLARELREKYPDDLRAATILAHEQLQKGNTDQGIRIFEELLAVDPNNAEAYNQIGYYYGYRGDYEKAVDNLKKYQFIAADSANPFDSLGEVQAYSGHYNEAIENLNRALAIKPDFSPAYEHLGVVYEGTGEYAKAIESYRKAVEVADTDDMKGKYLGEGMRAAFITHDLPAVADFRERFGRLAKDPYTEIRSAFLDAAVALAEGRAAEAEARLNKLRPQMDAKWQGSGEFKLPGEKPYFPDWNYVMAKAKEAQGKTDEATALYEANANPPRPFGNFESRRWIIEARAKVAEIIARKGDLDRAEKLIAENRKWNPSWAPCRSSEAAVAEARRAKVLAASR
jgi:tetratricopeptide (TPR) repeat protein